MKKNLLFFTIVLLTLLVVGFAFDHFLPAQPVQAAHSEAIPVTGDSAPDPAEATAAPLTFSTHPVVYLAALLVCLLFGVMAVCPLFIDDSHNRP